MMHRIFLLLSAAVLPLCSCVRDLDMGAGQEPVVVVECVLQDTSPQTLKLFYAKTGISTGMAPIPDAGVVLVDKTAGQEAGCFINTGGREWTMDYAAVPEHEYRLEIRIPGHDLIYAEDTMPRTIGILAMIGGFFFDSSHYDDSEYGDYGGKSFFSTVYHIKSLPKYSWIYALNFNPETGGHEIAEQICTDYPWVDKFNLSGESYVPEESDTTFIGHHYRVLSYPFLEGKAMHRRFIRLRAPDERELEEYLHKNPKLRCVVSGYFSGKYLQFCQDSPAEDEGYVVTMSASENYDNYLRDAVRSQQMQESSDMTTVYIRDNLYSNINGGVGIFGASVRRFQAWKRYSNWYEIN